MGRIMRLVWRARDDDGVAMITAIGISFIVFMFAVAVFSLSIHSSESGSYDRKARLHSVPAWLGIRTSLRVALASHLGMVALLVLLYWAAAPQLGVIYLCGIGAVAVLLAYEHWLVRPDDLSRVNQAFFQVNGVISVGLFLLVLLQLAVNYYAG